MPWDESRFPVHSGDPIGDVAFLQQFFDAVAERGSSGAANTTVEPGDSIVGLIDDLQEIITSLDRGFCALGRVYQPGQDWPESFDLQPRYGQEDEDDGIFASLGWGTSSENYGFTRSYFDAAGNQVTERGENSRSGGIRPGDLIGPWLFNELREIIDAMVVVLIPMVIDFDGNDSRRHESGDHDSFAAASAAWSADAGVPRSRTQLNRIESSSSYSVRSDSMFGEFSMAGSLPLGVGGATVPLQVVAYSVTSRASPFESQTIYNSTDAPTAGAPERRVVLVEDATTNYTATASNLSERWGGYRTPKLGVERPTVSPLDPSSGRKSTGCSTVVNAFVDLSDVFEFGP